MIFIFCNLIAKFLQNICLFIEEDLFQEHAVRNHPLSCVFFAEKLFEDQPTLEKPIFIEVTTEKGLDLIAAIYIFQLHI